MRAMTNKNILVLFAIGAVLILAGVILKISEMEYDSFFLIVGITFETVSIVMLILKMLKKGDNQDGFLDS